MLTNGEPHFRRHLRHWAERFAVSLAVACTNGLNLQLEWDRGLVLVLDPRAHRNIGSRWRVCSGGIFYNADIYGMLDGIGQPT